MISVKFPTIDVMLANMDKARSRKIDKINHRHESGTKRFDVATRTIDFQNAINKLNQKYNKEFYMEHTGLSFVIQGHREYGHMSRRNGILGQDIDLTLGLHEMEKAGIQNTIKMVVDNNNNYMMASLSKLRTNNEFRDRMLKDRFNMMHDNTIPYYSWTLEELRAIDAIMYYG